MPIQPKDTETILKEFSELYEKVKSVSDMQFVTGEWFHPALKQALASHLLWAETQLPEPVDHGEHLSEKAVGGRMRAIRECRDAIISLAQKITE